MMKRKVALLMTTVMLATSVFPAGITAYAEDVVVTDETAVESTLDGTLEESVDIPAVDDDVNVLTEDAGLEGDAVLTGVDAQQTEDEMIAEDMEQDDLTEEDLQGAPIVADEDIIVSGIEVVDEASIISANTELDAEIEENAIQLLEGVRSTVTCEGSKVFCYFEPETTGSYTIFSFGPNFDDEVEPEVKSLDDLSAEFETKYHGNFKKSYKLNEGTTYYFELSGYDPFDVCIYKTSDITLTGIGLPEGISAPAFVYGINCFNDCLDELIDQGMVFTYETRSEPVKELHYSWDLDDDIIYRDEYDIEVETIY